MVQRIVVFGAGNGGKAMAAELALRGLWPVVSNVDACSVHV